MYIYIYNGGVVEITIITLSGGEINVYISTNLYKKIDKNIYIFNYFNY